MKPVDWMRRWRSRTRNFFRYVFPRAAFGVLVSTENYLRGRSRMALFRLAARGRFGIRSDPRAGQYRRDGCFSVDAGFDRAALERIREAYLRVIHGSELTYTHGDVVPGRGDYQKLVACPQWTLPGIEDLLTDPIRRGIEAYYGSHFRVHRVGGWRIVHIPPDVDDGKFYASVWHVDNIPVSQLKLFINLSDVTDRDGPFHCVSIGRTEELIRMGFRDRYNYGLPDHVLEDGSHVVRAIGPMGSAVFCNTTLCLHRAGIPDFGRVRDILQFTFEPARAPLRPGWIDHLDVIPVEIDKYRRSGRAIPGR